MNAFRNVSIKNKLIGIILIVTSVVVGVGFTVNVFTTNAFLRDQLVRDTALRARLIGEYSVVPLSFGDQQQAEFILARLETLPSIDGGVVFDENGDVFAAFERSGEAIEQRLPSAGEQTFFAGDGLHTYQPVIYQGREYGTVYLRTSTSALDQQIWANVLAAIFTVVLLIGLSYILAHQLQGLISKPILELAQVAEKISEEGDYSLRVEKRSSDETGLLYDAFNDMLDQIRARQTERVEAERALKESERRFRGVFENATEGITLCEANGRVIEANPAFLGMMGYTLAELQTLAPDQVTHPDALEPEQALSQSVLDGERDAYEVEKRYVRKDGSMFWGRLSVAMVRDETGALVFVAGVVTDITEAREAREREQLLIQELNHRVKNAMATIVGLASATAVSATSVSEFMARFSRRIGVMAGLHEALARQDWADVSLKSLVENVAVAGDDVVHMEGPAVTLGARVAMPLGQALFELNANALRHGALSAPEGEVDIRWESMDEGTTRLHWTESGGPTVSAAPPYGVGLELLTGLVEQEIGGKLEIDFASDGVRAVVQFPSE